MHPENSFGISLGIPEIEYKKNVIFGLHAVAAPRTSRERAESMPILCGTRIHAVTTPATLSDGGDACDRS